MPTASHPEHVTHGGFRILVATDASPAGNAAVAWAASTFQSPGTTLHITHVVDAAHGPAAATAAEETLQTTAASLDGSDAHIETSVTSGRPVWEAIVEQAARARSDLLIIGVRGHSKLPWVRLGTTARRLVRFAPCPVLSLPPQSGPDAARPLHGLVGVDFSEESALATTAAIRLLGAAGGGRLTLLHVCESPSMPYEAMGYGPAQVTDELVEHRRREALHMLEGLAADATGGGVEATFAATTGQAAQSLEHYAEEADCDFIAVGTRGHTVMQRMILGSAAQRLLEGHARPVLTARSPAADQSIALSPADTNEVPA
ncbi:MAG: universal stress protein [Phycisphaerales bacterium]|jgi:nucleotide-binding universal stress UspA family protein|nr:universal stress protein [Phycisphaerales bacterium]